MDGGGYMMVQKSPMTPRWSLGLGTSVSVAGVAGMMGDMIAVVVVAAGSIAVLV